MSYPGLAIATDDRTTKASPADVRRKNRQLIFALLFPTKQYSRAELGRRTGLSRVAVSDVVGRCSKKAYCAKPARRPAAARANEARC